MSKAATTVRPHPFIDTAIWLPRDRGTSHINAVLAVLVVAFLVALFATNLDDVGVWDGDPAIHLRSAMEGANVFAREWPHGHPLKAYLHAFYFVPKAMHEIMLITFMVLASGATVIDFGSAERYATYFATIATTVGLAALFAILRIGGSTRLALLVLPLVASSGYIVLYANMQKGNMPAHALCWLASAIYIVARSRSTHLNLRTVVGIGALFAMAVPTHYSSLYWFAALCACEAALACWDRRWWRCVTTVLLVAGIALAWIAAVDAYRDVYTTLFPRERSWLGTRLDHPRFSLWQGFA